MSKFNINRGEFEVDNSGYSLQSATSGLTKKITIWGLIIVAIFFIIYMINRQITKGLPKDQNFTDNDEKRHGNAKAAEIDASLDKMTKDNLVIVGSSNYSPDQQTRLAEKITERYADRFETAAKKVAEQASAQSLGRGIAVFFTETNRTVPQQALDTYVTFATNALNAFTQVDAECVKALAAVAASTNSSLASAQQCHTYEYTAKTSELKTATSSHTEVTNVKNRGGAALFGLFRSKRADKEVTTTDFKQASHQRTVDYIPHCKGKTIDPATMEVMLGTQLNATISILQMSATAWNRYPKAEDFLPKK